MDWRVTPCAHRGIRFDHGICDRAESLTSFCRNASALQPETDARLSAAAEYRLPAASQQRDSGLRKLLAARVEVPPLVSNVRTDGGYSVCREYAPDIQAAASASPYRNSLTQLSRQTR